MNEKKKRITLPVVVEGRYDKSALLSIFDATVIVTDGFGIFNSKEKQALMRKIAGEEGIILLTDSDTGGKQIRAFLSGILPKDKIYQLYIPKIEGKERRKHHQSKEGILGVEGVGREVLERVLEKFISDDGGAPRRGEITKLDLYRDGFSGGDNSAALRDALCVAAGLPTGMSAKAMLEALNILLDKEKYEILARDIVSAHV